MTLKQYICACGWRSETFKRESFNLANRVDAHRVRCSDARDFGIHKEDVPQPDELDREPELRGHVKDHIESFHRLRCSLDGCVRTGPETRTKRGAWKQAVDEGWYVDARKARCPEHWPE